MKVKVVDLLPNPYRRMGKYPIDAAKVDALKTSIEQTEFWDNILARKSPVGDGYEIAYGHHRLEAIKQLGIEEIDIPVKDIDDATMLRIMANENMDEWRATPSVVNETIAAAKKFIDDELAKYETWEEFCSAKNSISNLVDSGHSFSKMKDNGAGRNIICAFLGGNWKLWMVEQALRVLNDDTLDREAVETFGSTKSAQEFTKAAKAYNIPKSEQKKVARQIVESGNDSQRGVKKAVQGVAKAQVEQPSQWQPDPRDIELEQLEQAIRDAAGMCSRAADKVQDVLDRMDDAGADSLAGPEPMNFRTRVVSLVTVLERIAPYIDLDISQEDLNG